MTDFTSAAVSADWLGGPRGDALADGIKARDGAAGHFGVFGSFGHHSGNYLVAALDDDFLAALQELGNWY